MDTEYRQFHEKLANRQLAATVGAAVVNSAFQAAQLKQAEVQHQERLLQDKIAHIEQMAAFEERNREVDYLNTLSLEGKKVYAQLKELGWSRQEIAYVFTLSPEDQGAYYTLRESGWQHEEIAFHLTLSPEGKQAHLELKDAGWGIQEIKHFLSLSPVERMTYLDEKEAASQRAAAEAARTAEWKETAKKICAVFTRLHVLGIILTFTLGPVIMIGLPILIALQFIWTGIAQFNSVQAQGTIKHEAPAEEAVPNFGLLNA